jgi:hypothetical protein
MSTWSLLLIPLAVLAIASLFPFIGCELEETGSNETPATIETEDHLVKLSWSGSANQIRSISFEAIVQELTADGIPTGLPLKGLGVSPGTLPPAYLPSTGDTSLNVTVELPLALSYAVTATVTVTMGEWGNVPTNHPFTISKVISGLPPNWQFSLIYVGQQWIPG